MDSKLKKTITDEVEEALKRASLPTNMQREISRISNTQVQARVREENGPPRYILVKITEMM